MQDRTVEYLDQCWAASLGCAVSQLRDGGQHVVAVPRSTGDVSRPWPLGPNSITMMTCGRGWVLCVPEQFLGQAEALCLDRGFEEIAREGDGQQESWFAQGARDEERATVRNVATYGPLTQLAASLNVSAWSHYFHWYCDSESWSQAPTSGNARLIQPSDPHLWEEWLKWPVFWGAGSKESGSYEAYGYVLDGRLVSVAQVILAPDDFAWEFGLFTQPEFRGRGFAAEAGKAATAGIIKHWRVPWYYYNHYNRPSSRMPQKLGYFSYAEALVSHGG